MRVMIVVLSVMLVMFKSFPTTSDLRKEKTLTRRTEFSVERG